MENASRALMMAASVLLAVLIIGALVFMFNNLSNLKQTEADSEAAEKLAEYNKQMETFNRDLYGSEILSLANLVIDYNIRQAEQKGYTPVTFEVTVNNSDDTDAMIPNKKYNQYEILEAFNALSDAVDAYDDINSDDNDTVIKIGEGHKAITKTARQINSMTTTQLKELLREYGPTYSDFPKKSESFESTIESAYNDAVEVWLDEKEQQIRELANQESKLRTELQTFKNTKFEITNIKYNQYNGRIERMIYKQKEV